MSEGGGNQSGMEVSVQRSLMRMLIEREQSTAAIPATTEATPMELSFALHSALIPMIAGSVALYPVSQRRCRFRPGWGTLELDLRYLV